MSLRIRFRFDGKCRLHPRYNPEKDGRPQRQECPGCESLWVIHLYTGIARRKAEAGDGILVYGAEALAKAGDLAEEQADAAGAEPDNEARLPDTTSID